MDLLEDSFTMEDVPSPPTPRSAEMEEFVDRLRTLPQGSLTEFCKAVDELALEYDDKATMVAEELAAIEESLPGKLKELHQLKAELKNLKTKMLSSSAGYKSHARRVVEAVKEHTPGVLERLESVGEKTARLRRLKAKKRAEELLANCELTSTSKDAEGTGKALQEAMRHVQTLQEVDASSVDEYRTSLKKISASAAKWAEKCLEDMLNGIGWPWSEGKDERAYKRFVKDAIPLLRVIYLFNVLNIDDQGKSGIHAVELCRTVFARVEVRFKYHFYGSRKTADIRHPEYFLQQLLDWMRNSVSFFTSILQPVFDEMKESVSAHDQFLHLLSVLGVEKAKDSIQSREVADDIVFSHIIDELIVFEDERQELDHSESGQNVLSVLCDEKTVKRWIEVENRACSSRMDDLLLMEERWMDRFKQLRDADPLLVCECTDAFVCLIASIRSRSRLLPSYVARRFFVELQLLLIDDFRTRLVHISKQSKSPWTTPYPQIMNSMWFMAMSIEDWGESDLVSGVEGANEKHTVRGVLEESVQMYRHVWNQMADDLVSSFRSQLRDYTNNYAMLNWRSSPAWKGSRDLSLPFCSLLLLVRRTFSSTAESFSRPSLVILFKQMVRAIAEALLEDVINVVHFNAEGGEQMSHDVNFGLITVLNSMFQRSEMEGMKAENDKMILRVLGALRLLSLSSPNAVLLREELESSVDESAEEKLSAMSIFSHTKETAIALLNKRCDINFNSQGMLFR